jgi:5-methylcytosine-specific restriction endonuclease McrA
MLWDYLNSKIIIDNKYIGNIKTSKLLNQEIEIPNIQRIRDDNKINDIVNYQINYYKNNNKFNFLGVINIHYCKENNLFFLVDGQHRYESIKKLYNDFAHDIEVIVEIIYVETKNDLKNNYQLINKNTPLPDFPENIDKNIPEKVAMNFKNKYPSIWSNNSRANRPNIFFNYFQEALGYLTHRLKIENSKELQELVENYNSKLVNWDKKQFPESSTITDIMFKKCSDTKMYLGLYKHKSDEYRYKWVKKIIEIETGEIIKDEIKKRKINIPKKVKIDAWNQHVGKGEKEALCICCREKTIDACDFHAGHIISEKNGGETTINNILPICSGCNLSMGSKNMGEYVEKHYPGNYIDFSNKNYKNYKKSWSIF